RLIGWSRRWRRLVERPGGSVEKPAGVRSETTYGPYVPQHDAAQESTMVYGTVKWVNDDKAFGFINVDVQADVFVLWCNVNINVFKTLDDGQNVVFEVVDGPKGREAADVCVR